ncbi:4Fe-4S ferredoxin iron-sulfur binding domain protein [Gloeothece citriformis PCC 7424]|uniref:4Fe-4S ferredoxin iron-sulfur binding domain protein n=1 Tax=Gloeothece citriformis (strain PCC 7424) TaxID=65393 RepID=B7KAE3_GLOC7|nr:LdpA C-terminal domain-containing domain [Gloeothece citriformis]ACK72917.1 4Fe-4S ferredoxin iron-sulfur binding domain protein [Gloeothece citriformis PCC 7424]
MNNLYFPWHALKEGHWFKLICGASFQDLPTIRSLTLAYTLAGADCIDVAADPAVIRAALEGLLVARQLSEEATKQGFLRVGSPWLMVSVNDAEDPHFRKAEFDATQCPSECLRPCEGSCPAQAISFEGVIDSRCYGCGRCIPVCPSQLIMARSYVSTPTAIAPLIQQMGIDALEIHTQVGHEQDFIRLWNAIAPWSDHLKLLAISCQEHEDLIEYLRFLYDLISPLKCPLIWQTDGRPMSGDIGQGTTHPAIKMAQKVLQANLPGYVQLAGGTNHYTVTKLRQMDLLNPNRAESNREIVPNLRTKPDKSAFVSGIAYGSYARSLLLPILGQLDTTHSSNHNLENHPELLWSAVKQAYSLVAPLKRLTPLPVNR